MHGYYDVGFGHMPMMLLWIVIFGVVIWALLVPKRAVSQETETPLVIAKKRYAAGEITKQELDEIKRNL